LIGRVADKKQSKVSEQSLEKKKVKKSSRDEKCPKLGVCYDFHIADGDSLRDEKSGLILYNYIKYIYKYRYPTKQTISVFTNNFI